jgi:hypothetical protein
MADSKTGGRLLSLGLALTWGESVSDINDNLNRVEVDA